MRFLLTAIKDTSDIITITEIGNTGLAPVFGLEVVAVLVVVTVSAVFSAFTVFKSTVLLEMK